MALVHLLQTLATAVSARDAVVVVVFAATLATAVHAFYRAPLAFARHRLVFCAVAVGALALFVAPRGWLPFPAIACMAIAAVAGFCLQSLADRRSDDGAIEEPPPKFDARLWIGSASILTAIFLLADLGGYSGSLMIWEPEAMRGLVEAFKNDVSWMRFAVSRLLWGQGLVSSGHDSLLYGSGTYALWKLHEISPTTLRLMAAVLAAACLPAAYGLGRAIGGQRVATAALVVIAVNPAVLFYGRYGASLTATFFAVLLLLWICLRLLDPNLEARRYGLAAAGSAYLATLGYATGRVVTVAVVTTTLLYGLLQWRRLPRTRRRVFIVMAIVLAMVWCVQVAFNRSREFINVNSEHIMMTDIRPEWVEHLLGEDADPTQLTLNQRLVMVRRVAADALPELRKVVSFPFIRSTHPWLAIGGDPPEFPLVQGPLLLFSLWGLSLSLAARRRRWPLLLVIALAAATLPLLLTNRVDLHRMSLAALPFVLWAAVGLVAAHRVMRECGIPAVIIKIVAAVVFALVAADNATFLFYPTPPPPSRRLSAVSTELVSLDGPVAVGVSDDFQSEAAIELLLLDRQRCDDEDRGEILWREIVGPLTSETGADPESVVRIEGMLHDATVLLAPLRDFDAAIDGLRARGMTAQAIGDEPGGFWRLDRLSRGDRRPFRKVESPLDLNPKPRRARATPHPSTRPRIPLTEATVREVYHGFDPPRYDTARDAEPITMDGASYGFGISMHAWTHMVFSPPPGARALEGVIGLTDAVSGCDQARVTFEVWGEDDRRIFDSGPFHAGMAPKHFRVPLDHASTITLVVTEAGNGPECDQVFWAEPYFTLTH